MEQKTVLEIRHEFTHADRIEWGDRLARANRRVYALQGEQKRLAADLGARLKAAQQAAAQLTDEVSEGAAMLPVECWIRYETPRPGMKQIVRCDNGEVVSELAITMEEMQQTLQFGEGTTRQ